MGYEKVRDVYKLYLRVKNIAITTYYLTSKEDLNLY